MTRAAPARLLGLADRGHLAPGARADIAVYRPQPDRAAMFRHAALVFKDGALVVRDGRGDRARSGPRARGRAGIRRGDRPAARGVVRSALRRRRIPAFDVPADAIGRAVPFETVPCRA